MWGRGWRRGGVQVGWDRSIVLLEAQVSNLSNLGFDMGKLHVFSCCLNSPASLLLLSLPPSLDERVGLSLGDAPGPPTTVPGSALEFICRQFLTRNVFPGLCLRTISSPRMCFVTSRGQARRARWIMFHSFPEGPRQDWAPVAHSGNALINTPFISFPFFPVSLTCFLSSPPQVSYKCWNPHLSVYLTHDRSPLLKLLSRTTSRSQRKSQPTSLQI